MSSADEPLFPNEADDDRDDIGPDDRLLLIVENDLPFAKVLLESARQQGYKGIVATTGAQALAMTLQYPPGAVTLDIFLPDMQGWRILERLKADLRLRHVPVVVASTDESRERAYAAGAYAFLSKPLQSKDIVDQAIAGLQRAAERPQRVVVAMPPSRERQEFLACLRDVDVTLVEQAATLAQTLSSSAPHMVVVGTRLGGLDLDALRETMEAIGPAVPLVLHAPPHEAGHAAAPAWRPPAASRVADSVIRLFDHTAFFLHRDMASMPEPERHALEELHRDNRALQGRKALIVDDDMRNIFALATVLDDHGMRIVSAENGRDAIRLVQEQRDIDIVLMDIMMPEMDGIATIQEIRKLPGGRELPIVAVTAKAMKGDREKCLLAGAWDYLSKPVDTPHLLAVLRSWLCR